ncbi:MAG: hypothetical protein DMG79_20085 [Acidobacteria bacterium]|nr:MAG: hypothetical protein DMG79_20085 [Acidobacteriota bacterium]
MAVLGALERFILLALPKNQNILPAENVEKTRRVRGETQIGFINHVWTLAELIALLNPTHWARPAGRLQHAWDRISKLNANNRKILSNSRP